MRKLLVALFSLALVAGLAACGDDGDDGGSATTTTDAPADAPATDDEETDDPSDDPTGDTTDTPAGGDEQDYVDALVVNLTSGSEEDGQFVIADDDAPCVAEAWIDIVTVEALVDAGVEPEDLADPSTSFTSTTLDLELDQGRDMVAAAEDCGVDLLGEFRTFAAEDLTPEAARCLNDELDDDLLAELVAQLLVADQPSADLQAEIQRIDEACQLS